MPRKKITSSFQELHSVEMKLLIFDLFEKYSNNQEILLTKFGILQKKRKKRYCSKGWKTACLTIINSSYIFFCLIYHRYII